MSRKKTQENFQVFCDEMNEKTLGLSAAEKTQYIEGLLHVCVAITKLCRPDEISPVEREGFILSIQARAFVEARDLGLDHVKALLEANEVNVAKAYTFATIVQEALGISLSSNDAVKARYFKEIAGNVLPRDMPQ